MNDSLWTTQQTCDFLGIKPNTLEKWRLTGEGPEFVRVGKLVRYRPDSVTSWLEKRTRRSTSEKVKTLEEEE